MEALANSVAQNGPQRLAVDELGEHPAEDPEQDRVDVEQPGDEHQREEPRDDEVLDGVDAEDLQRVELLADLARAEVGGDRGARDAREHDRGDDRADLADRGEHEDPAEAVQRPEDRQEVRGLQAGGGVADADRRDQQRKPAQPQREQELRDELAPVRVGGAQRGDDGPARQDHHVPDFLDEVPRREERPLCCAANHFLYPSSGHSRRIRAALRELYAMRWRSATLHAWKRNPLRGLTAGVAPATGREAGGAPATGIVAPL